LSGDFFENTGIPIVEGTHLQELNPDEIRGARQQHYGYSSNYSLSRRPKEQGGLVSPRIVGGSLSPDCVPTFVGKTRLAARKMLKEQGPGKLYDDNRRNHRSARLIDPDNRVEAVTYSETEEGGALLKMNSHECARKTRKEQGPGKLYDDDRRNHRSARLIYPDKDRIHHLHDVVLVQLCYSWVDKASNLSF
jgi:hypothetical protein